MEKSEIWPTIHTERAALAADLEPLKEPDWETPSLCPDWTVRDVVAHMTGTAKISPGSFVGKLVTSGFSLKRLQEKDIAELRGDAPTDTLANFKAEVNSSKHPPGPTDTWLGEAIVHSEDVRRRPGECRHGSALRCGVARGRRTRCLGTRGPRGSTDCSIRWNRALKTFPEFTLAAIQAAPGSSIGTPRLIKPAA